MTDARRLTWYRWASLALIGFGVLNLLALISPLSAVMDAFVDLAFLPFDGAQRIESDGGRLWVGIAGGLLAGLGATFLQVTRRVAARDLSEARAIVLPGILAWYLVDGLGSAAAGAPFNIVVNTGFLAAFLVPTLWPSTPSGKAPA
ncbi:MAG: excinuclease ABC subunit A [Pseudomonadota bacterium]